MPKAQKDNGVKYFLKEYLYFSYIGIFTRYSWRIHAMNVWKLTTNIMKMQELKNENALFVGISNFCKRQHKLPFTVNIVLLLCHTVLWNVYEFNLKELAYNWKVWRDWSPKFENELNVIVEIDQKMYEWPAFFLCWNDVLIGGSFWQKDSMVTIILFDL